MEKGFKLMVAPLQGLTEAVWRREHFRLCGLMQGEVEYFTPFIRVEKGVVRARDLRDYTSELNQGMNITPQIIFRDIQEWRMLVETLARAGAARIDLNMGCPFPPQVHKGRGAGLLSRPEALAEVAEAMRDYADSIEFSVKMRLGVMEASEAMAVTEIMNVMPLRHVAIHPRTARQQYKGALHINSLYDFSSALRHPVIFNGEITAPSEIQGLTGNFAGVMAGRGLLRRPTLFAEYKTGTELPQSEREQIWLDLIKATAAARARLLCGSTQLMDKMKPYWEYAPEGMDKKLVKQGKKKGIIL